MHSNFPANKPVVEKSTLFAVFELSSNGTKRTADTLQLTNVNILFVSGQHVGLIISHEKLTKLPKGNGSTFFNYGFEHFTNFCQLDFNHR